MEDSLKKKTKQLITLKTNNFIDSEIDKQNFFQHLLKTLQSQLSHQEFLFLTSYLLLHPNHQKPHQQQTKKAIQKRISTLPDQKPFNLGEIDPDLFRDKPTKQDNFLYKESSPKTLQNDHHATNTPRKNSKHLIFENKRIMDLDKRLKAKYQAHKNFIVYNPKVLTSEKQPNTQERFYLKTSYQNSLKRKSNKQNIRRLKTSFQENRDSVSTKREKQVDFQNSFLNKNLCNAHDPCPSERFRTRQNSIPKYLLEQVMLNRRHYKMERNSNDFSDFKFSSRYKDCFS